MATITVAELATELHTDARTARKFLRSITPADEQPGKGGRWTIEKKQVRSIKSKFTHYTDELTAKNAKDEVADTAADEANDTATE